jgi:hypothetical protein
MISPMARADSFTKTAPNTKDISKIINVTEYKLGHGYGVFRNLEALEYRGDWVQGKKHG